MFSIDIIDTLSKCLAEASKGRLIFQKLPKHKSLLLIAWELALQKMHLYFKLSKLLPILTLSNYS